jgi:hypothetical protein
VLQYFLVELEELLMGVGGEVVLGPCTNDQIELPNSQILGSEKHLIPQRAHLLLDG